MFEPSPTPRVFGQQPGTDFPASLVAGLFERMRSQPPEAMARVTLIVNTDRMVRRLRDLFLAREATFIPKIRLVTDPAPLAFDLNHPAAAPAMKRRLELMQLVVTLLEAQPDLAARSSAFALSESLAALMDEAQGEGMSADVLQSLDVSDQSDHWKRALQFVTLAQSYQDQIATEPDPLARLRNLTEALIEDWQTQPPADPIIVAGSTGSRGTTRLLIEAVARLPQGAVILPGFDPDLPAAVWDALQDPMTATDHAQFQLAKTIKACGITPAEVLPWFDADPYSAARNKAVSLALRPAPITDAWLEEGPALPNLVEAFSQVTLLEADTRRNEALAIALRLRMAAEQGQTAAMITPDRLLGREVAATLDRWNIIPDDSGGLPLHLSAPGRFVRHISALFLRKMTASSLLEILRHPLCHSGAERGEHLLLTRDLELYLRKYGQLHPDASDIAGWRAKTKREMAGDWATWITTTLCRDHIAEFPNSLSGKLEHLKTLSERLCNGHVPDAIGNLWSEESGQTVKAVIDKITRFAGSVPDMATHDFAALLDSALADESLRDSRTPHPQIRIWSTLQARVQGSDLVILAGLNEGVWPSSPQPDLWMNRSMRRQAGLLLPERQIGLAAHDFQQAIASKEVWLTRSLRSDDADTVPSRWVNRLTNMLAGLPQVGGKDALKQMRDAGAKWLKQAEALEQFESIPPANRPSPRPPVETRPKGLSVTEISRLVRDPYAIYAKHVLRLRPLDPLDRAPDALLRGIELHEVYEKFIRATIADPGKLTAEDLVATARTHLEENVPWPDVRMLWLARVERIADWFIAGEIERQSTAQPTAFERTGTREMTSPAFTLTGRADRIDRDVNGSWRIYDYKTGSVSTAKQQKIFDPQLLLLAAIAEESGFKDVPPGPVSLAAFIAVSANPEEVSAPLDDCDPAQSWADLAELVSEYNAPTRGYTPRLLLYKDGDHSDYDHLSRYGEWDPSHSPVPEDLT